MSEPLDPLLMELDHRQLAGQSVAQAKEQEVELVGPAGLLNRLTKNVLDTESPDRLGCDRHWSGHVMAVGCHRMHCAP